MNNLIDISYIFVYGSVFIFLFFIYSKYVNFGKFEVLSPLIFISTIGFIGCLFSAFYKSVFFFSFIILILYIFIKEKPRLNNGKINFNAGLSYIFFFSIKIYTIYNFNTGELFCSHYDDYAYLQQSTMLLDKKVEVPYFDLINNYFGENKTFGLYHYFEFYVLIFFKMISVKSFYLGYHFFLWPVFQFFGFYSGWLFFNVYFRKGNNLDLLIYFIVFSTIRFTIYEELLSSWINIKYFNHSFFQNYSFSHPLSYWSGLKNSIVFIFIFPLIGFIIEKRYVISFLLLVLNFSVSIVHVPFVIIWMLISIFNHRFSYKFILLISGLFFSAVQIWNIMHFGESLNSIILYNFNLWFENFYWALIFISILVFLRKRKFLWLLSIVFSFPFIYINHKIFFKIFISIFIFFIPRLFKYVDIFRAKQVIPLYFFLLGLSQIVGPFFTDSDQIFSNLLYLSFLLLFLDVLYFLDFGGKRLSWMSIILLIAHAVGVFMSLIHENERPLSEEDKINLIVSSNKIYRVLCLPVYTQIPFHYRHLLGGTILHYHDNFAILMGGFDKLSRADLASLETKGRITSNPYYRYWKKHGDKRENPSIGFSNVQGLDFIFVEDHPIYSDEISYFRTIARREFKETRRNYFVFQLR